MVTLGTRTEEQPKKDRLGTANRPVSGVGVTSVLHACTGGVLTIEYRRSKITDTWSLKEGRFVGMVSSGMTLDNRKILNEFNE